MSHAAAAVTVQSTPGLWATLREAVKGSHQDYTEAPVGQAVILLAVPMVLEMLMESVFAVADIFFVGRLGADAVATVGITESLMTIVYAVAMGLSIGATATVSRRIGEKNPDAAARAAVQSIAVGVLVGIAVGVTAVATAPSLLRLMGASDEVVRTGANFTRVMLGASGSVLLLFLINAIFRGAGDAAIAMRVLWFANAVNIVLGPCLIFGIGPFPEMGVTGAAVGTAIGRTAGVALSALPVDPRRWSNRAPRRAFRAGLGRHAIDHEDVRRGRLPEFHRHRIVDGAGADPHRLRQRRRGGQHHRHPHHHVRPAAVVRRQQRRGDARRPEPRRAPARPGGSRRLAGRAVQHVLPGDGRGDLPAVRAAADPGCSPTIPRSCRTACAACESSPPASCSTATAWC